MSTVDMQEAIERLYEAVEPLCGFRPESTAQAISLLVARFLETVPALEAMSALALEMDAAEGDKS